MDIARRPRQSRGEAFYAAVIVCVVVFPVAAALATGTYLVLRRWWPDRAVAAAMVAVSLPSAVYVIWSTDYLGRWWTIAVSAAAGHGSPTPADWAVVAVAGLLLGPFIGAVYWRITQRGRERSPFYGADERERRLRTEETRRWWTTRVIQRVRHTGPPVAAALVRPLAVGPGDDLGPYLGRYLRGDLGQPWRAGSRVRWPMGHPDNRHGIVLGATGLGKTEVVLGPIVEWAAAHGWQVIYLTCKEPPSTDQSAAPRLAAIAARHDLTCRVLTPGYGPYDPMRGHPDAIRDRLIRIQQWGDEYWSHCANLLVGLALDLSAEAGKPLTGLPDLVYSLVTSQLRQLARTSQDDRVRMLVDALDDRALSGALTRYASMALHLRGWIAPREAGGWSWEDADVACVELPTSSAPEAADALMRMMLRDVGSYLTDPARRQTLPDGRQRPLLLVIEEVGAVTCDPVLGREFVAQVERARAARSYTLMTAQDPIGIGDERTVSAILTNATILTYRQTVQAQRVAQLAGTTRVTEGGADYDADGTWQHQGVMRRQHSFKVNPQLLRELRQGEFVLINRGHYLKGVAALTALGYRVPDIPLVRQVVDELERSRTAIPLQRGEEPRGGDALPVPVSEW